MAMAAHPSHLAGGTSRRWLMLVAGMAWPGNGSRWPSPDPGPWGRPACRGSPRAAPGAGAGSVRQARDFTVATLHRLGAAERSHDIVVLVF